MKKLFIILAAVAMVFVACKKENPTNNNHGWGAETLTFKVNNSTDIIMKKVEGGFIDKLNAMCAEPAAIWHALRAAYHGREKEHNGHDATLGFRIVLR